MIDKIKMGDWGIGDLIERAWGIIANAGGGDWSIQTDDWQKAASEWREAYHEYLRQLNDVSPH